MYLQAQPIEQSSKLAPNSEAMFTMLGFFVGLFMMHNPLRWRYMTALSHLVNSRPTRPLHIVNVASHRHGILLLGDSVAEGAILGVCRQGWEYRWEGRGGDAWSEPINASILNTFDASSRSSKLA